MKQDSFAFPRLHPDFLRVTRRAAIPNIKGGSDDIEDQQISILASELDKLQLDHSNLSEYAESLEKYIVQLRVQRAKLDISLNNSNISELLTALDWYAAEYPGQPVSAKFHELVEQLRSAGKLSPTPDESPSQTATVLLPNEAPVLWRDRDDKSMSPAEFIKETYEPWIGKGLTRSHIRALDPSLYSILSNWLNDSSKNNKLDFDLPSRKEMTDSWIARVESDPSIQAGIKAGNRYRSAKSRRTGTD